MPSPWKKQSAEFPAFFEILRRNSYLSTSLRPMECTTPRWPRASIIFARRVSKDGFHPRRGGIRRATMARNACQSPILPLVATITTIIETDIDQQLTVDCLPSHNISISIGYTTAWRPQTIEARLE
eukprot:scaffold5143_cov52-Attheya_sp.AAC.2